MAPKSRKRSAPSGAEDVSRKTTRRDATSKKASTEPEESSLEEETGQQAFAEQDDPPRKYRHIGEGVGGTYTIDPEAPCIGTDGCFTCLGVYFAIDKHRCFVAHINIEPLPANGIPVPDAHRDVRDYLVKTAAERSIIWWVKRKLNDEAWSEDWGPITELMRDSLVVVCPNSNLRGRTLIGDAALNGVFEFLGIDATDSAEMRPGAAQGFVVTHTGDADGDVALFPADHGFWEAVTEGVGTKNADGEEGGEGERAGDVNGLNPVRNWEWGHVRHDGQVMVEGEEDGMEGPYHID